MVLRGRDDDTKPYDAKSYGLVSKRDKNVEEFSIFFVEPDTEENETQENNDEKIFHVYSMFWEMTDLRDGTFLLYDSHCDIILRLDRNLKTKFKPKHTIDLGKGKILKTNFFILPYSTIKYFYDNVLTEYEGKQTYKLNLELLNYLYEEQEKGLAMY